ncbi:hypothetical protein PM082_022452 [Marasmius tenuissimus]|nr:hypothetical protein PM082_022452 [Marasmius tenuissimus]
MERVDDTDSRLVYTPSKEWHVAGVPAEFMHSTHWTNTSDAQMAFQFKGTKISAYGTISSNLPTLKTLTLISVDDGEPVRWEVSPQEEAVYHQLMFDSPILKDGVHILTMKATVNGSETFLDYLEFAPSQPSSISSSSELPTSTSSNSGAPIPATSVVVQVSQGGALPAGAVAGISVAATLAVISGLGCLFFWWKQRHRRRLRDDPSGPQVTPYPLMSTTRTTTSYETTLPSSGTSGPRATDNQSMSEYSSATRTQRKPPPPYRK